MNMILCSPPFRLSPSEMGTLHTIPGDQYIHTRTLNFQSISAARKMLGDSGGGRCYLIWGVFLYKMYTYIYIYPLHYIKSCALWKRKKYVLTSAIIIGLYRKSSTLSSGETRKRFLEELFLLSHANKTNPWQSTTPP